MIGLKRVAVTGVAATMAVAAMAAVTVRLSKPPSHTHAAVLAMMHGSGPSPAHPQAPPAQLMASAMPGGTGMGQPAAGPAPRMASAMPAEPVAPPPEPMKMPHPGAPVPAPVPFYTAPNDPAPVLAQAPHDGAHSVASAGSAQRPWSGHSADTAQNDVPAAIVTLISQATFVPPPSNQRPLVLPITFGAPLAPETDAAPVDTHWRHHGLVRRRSYFLPAPGDDDARAFCPSPAPLP